MDLSITNITLRNLDGPLPIQAVRAHAMNGMFYTELDRRHHQWVNKLHHLEKKEVLPFSLSPIFDEGFFLGLRVGALTGEAGDRIRETWVKLCDEQTIVRLGSAAMVVESVHSGNPWDATYKKIWETAPVKFGIRLAFETPFRLGANSGVNHYSLLPAPKGVWLWLSRRWEAFSSISLPPELIRWVEWQVNLIEVQLETVYGYIEKDIEWKGVIGEVAYQAFPGAPELPESRLPDYLRAFQALAMLAEYSGAGEKTGWGMGRVRRVRTFSPFRGEHGNAGSGEGE